MLVIPPSFGSSFNIPSNRFYISCVFKKKNISWSSECSASYAWSLPSSGNRHSFRQIHERSIAHKTIASIETGGLLFACVELTHLDHSVKNWEISLSNKCEPLFLHLQEYGHTVSTYQDGLLFSTRKENSCIFPTCPQFWSLCQKINLRFLLKIRCSILPLSCLLTFVFL